MAASDATGSTRSDSSEISGMCLDLLGFDRPLNAVPRFPLESSKDGADVFRLRCPNAVTDWGGRPLTVREQSMITIMGEIMEKADWPKKVFDDSIVGKWRSEAVLEDNNFSELMFKFCIDELRDNAKMEQRTGLVPAISANAIVYRSDVSVSQELMGKIRTAVAPLESVPPEEKDWHPHSGNQVLDLVHPSLFPLIYGKTRLMTEEDVPIDDAVSYCGKGVIVPIPQQGHLTHKILSRIDYNQGMGMYSNRFQWLPCEVEILEGDGVQIRSYINNLHPGKHGELYEAIESVISRAIPMWNLTLAHILKRERKAEVESIPEVTHGYYPSRIRVTGEPEWTVDEPIVPEGEDPETYEFDDWIEYGVNWKREGLVQPEPSQEMYKERRKLLAQTEVVNLYEQFGGVQIIVKLANIHLTPESPVYEGGKWHIEGQLNEHICASALLYYDNDNITESYLAFRERVDADAFVWGSKEKDGDRGYEQGFYDHLEHLYGVQSGETIAIQNLGRVLTDEGRLVVFPNVLQHRVEPFRLRDPSKPGHRKIMALFLVDPYLRIPSTTDVPPQQKEWWAEMVSGLDRVSQLPPELINNVLDQAGDFPITMDEAKELRLELMDERTAFVDEVNKDYEHYRFSFCEH